MNVYINPTLVNQINTKVAAMIALPHQERVSNRLAEEGTPGLIVYHGLGSGKTFTAINAAQKQNLPLLAIVPASLRNNFNKEIESAKFSNPYKVVSYEEAHKLKTNPDFLNYASNALVAYDEASLMGRNGTQRSLLANEIPAKKKLFLTGTPIRNGPHELAPLLNALGGYQIPVSESSFKDNFIEEIKRPSTAIERFRGIKPGVEGVQLKNLDNLREALKNKIDYHSSNKEDFPQTSEETIEVPMNEKQTDLYKSLVGKNPQMAYKIKYGIPPSKEEMSRFQAFSIGPRQIVNTTRNFDIEGALSESPKIDRAILEIQKRMKNNPEYRGVSYSNFLESGALPLQKSLTEKGISNAIFSGGISDANRKKIIDDYNSGKIKQLILTSAGSQGLDLKKTRLVQLLDPHWNEAKMDQVQGRAVRYKSHEGLPDKDRTVEIQSFLSTDRDKLNTIQKYIYGKDYNDSPTIDHYINTLSNQKQKTIDKFLDEVKQSK